MNPRKRLMIHEIAVNFADAIILLVITTLYVKVVQKLFSDLSTRFANRNGGYTRIIRKGNRVGDNAPTCFIEYLAD